MLTRLHLHKKFEEDARDKLFSILQGAIELTFTKPVALKKAIDDRIESMPFYQVQTFTFFYKTTFLWMVDMDWRLEKFRYGVPAEYFDHIKYVDFRFVLLLSKFAPGQLWFYMRKFYESRMLIQLGIDGSWKLKQEVGYWLVITNTQFFLDTAQNKEGLKALTRFCKLVAEYNVPWKNHIKDIPYFIHNYVAERGCHLPLSCTEVADCDHTIIYNP